MNNEKKLEVGQEVIVVPTGNAARRSSKVYDAEITKIGVKYFELKDVEGTYNFSRVKFHINSLTQKTEYTSNYTVHLDKELYLEERKKAKIWDSLRKERESYNVPSHLSLVDLELIEKMLISEKNHK